MATQPSSGKERPPQPPKSEKILEVRIYNSYASILYQRANQTSVV
jgi:hypothetical protein